MNDMEDVDQPVAPPPRKPKNGLPPNPREEVSSAAEMFSGQDDRSVFEWLTEVGTGASLKIKLIRVTPATWQGHNIKGHIDEFDTPFSEKEIQSRFGGGKFLVRTWKQSAKGNWVYSGTRTFEIAGDPKVTGELMHGGVAEEKELSLPPEGMATTRAMNMVERVAEQERKRAERMEDEIRSSRREGPDMAMFNAALAPLNAQIAAMNAQLLAAQKVASDKDTRILELATRKPETTFQDTLLGKMVDGESARIEGIRENHASELRQLRENHASELKASREHHREELAMRENTHAREINTLERSHASSMDSIKLSYEGRIDAFKSRISDLEQRLSQMGAELGAIRDKKDKGLIEQMEEMATVKNAMEALGMGGGGEPQGSVMERIAMGVLESPVVRAIATRVEQAPAQATPPPQQAAPPQRRRRPAPPPQQPQQAAPPTAPQAPQAVGQMAPVRIQVNPADVLIAVNLLEGAIKNGTDPVTFAESARSMVPADILAAVKQLGVDAFLKSVAKLEDGSPLATMGGRNFLRKVVKYLSDGTTE